MTKENIYFDYENKNKWKFPRKYYNQTRLDFLKENILKLNKGSKILDMGCGSGDMTCIFHDDYRVFGLDNCKEAIEYCNKSYRKAEYKLGDLYNTGYEDESFDAIILTDVIEHLYNPQKALSEIRRVLKPKGTLLLTTPNYSSITWILIEQTWFRFFGGNCKPYKRDIHPSKFTKKKLINLLRFNFPNTNVETICYGLCLTTVAKKSID